MTYGKLIERHGPVIDTLLYNSIKVAIPKLWKPQIKDLDLQSIEDDHIKIEKLLQQSQASKYLYWQQISRKHPTNTSLKLLWEKYLQMLFDQDEWTKCLLSPFNATIATKLRNFQYRLVNRILTTNTTRNKWSPNISPLCTFCKRINENTVHLFIECDHVKRIWVALSRWVKYFMQLEVQFVPELIVFNHYMGQNAQLINTIIIIAKQFIYAKKCKQILPNFVALTEKIIHWYNIEKTFAIATGNVSQLKRKWKKYENYM